MRSRLRPIVCALILVVIGFCLIRGFDKGPLTYVLDPLGAAALVGAWAYLRNGLWAAKGKADPLPVEAPTWPAGDWSVELVQAGRTPTAVVEQIRRLTGLDSDAALALLDELPATVLTGVNGRTAHDAQTAFESAGAVARMTWPEDSLEELPAAELY